MAKAPDRVGGLIIAGFVVLALIYSVVNPLFESPDERLHFEYVRALIDERALPVQSPTAQTEFHQPPLYYALNALIAAPLPAEPVTLPINSFWNTQPGPPLNDSKNLYLHTAAEDWPFQGGVLTVHVLRLLSIVLGAITLFIVNGLLREVFAQRTGLRLGALAVAAFNPQFIFISASINNDNLANLLGAAMIAWSVRVVRNGITPRRVIVGGVLIGGAALSKLSSLPLAAVMALALLLAPVNWPTRFKAGLGLGGVALSWSGWWFARNVALYGDLTGVSMMLQAWGPPPPALTISGVGPQIFDVWRSYWGKFGYGQIALHEAIYWALALLTLGSLIGLVVGRRRAGLDRRTAWVLISAWGLSLLAAGVFSAQNPSGLHGRFLLPASSVLAIAISLGLRGWASSDRLWIHRALSVALLALPVIALVAYLIPTYTPPPLLSLTEVRARTQPVDIRFGDEAILLGYGAVPRQLRPTDRFSTTLCWQALKPAASNVYAFVQLTGEADVIVAQRRMFTGQGQRLSREWTGGEIFCDDVHLNVEEWAATPRVYQLEVGLVDPATNERLTPVDATGHELGSVRLTSIAVQSLASVRVPAVAQRPEVNFGGQIALLGAALEPAPVDAGQTITLTLYWRAVQQPDRDYTVFVHILDEAGQPAAQADSMPNQNRYPTLFWTMGEIVGDPHPIDLPRDLAPGTYTIEIGWYDLASGNRLPMNNDPAGVLNLSPLTVEVAR
ncbi:MAG: glycosyltransferase family 39 protein [Thermoflexales bacterium]|nr:glycosyltransferase family 39 protein [Thermoflexales bacterium]